MAAAVTARAVLVMLLALSTTGAAQAPGDSAVAAREFVAQVREATVRYRDQAQAVQDGYRPIGPDFPGMGEHWISVPLLLEGGLDRRRPPILEYARLGGEVTLVGAAFAVLLAAGQPPPALDGLTLDPTAWHYHGGTVQEESFVAAHAHGHPSDAGGPRVAVLHVWAWLDNPDGPFATDNWALPFARLGLPRPALPPNRDVAHALALASGGEGYYLALVAAVAPLDSMQRAAVTEGLARAAAEIRSLLERYPLEESLPLAGSRWVALRGDVPSLP
ncbi:MAG: hypothetical protein ABR551_03030 [Gemmatimonadales bacterium]